MQEIKDEERSQLMDGKGAGKVDQEEYRGNQQDTGFLAPAPAAP